MNWKCKMKQPLYKKVAGQYLANFESFLGATDDSISSIVNELTDKRNINFICNSKKPELPGFPQRLKNFFLALSECYSCCEKVSEQKAIEIAKELIRDVSGINSAYAYKMVEMASKDCILGADPVFEILALMGGNDRRTRPGDYRTALTALGQSKVNIPEGYKIGN